MEPPAAPRAIAPADPPAIAQAGRILALDIGDRRIGLAASVPPGALILPAGHLPRRSAPADVATILHETRRRNAVAIVAGMPNDAHGRPGFQARKTRRLLYALARAAPLPIFVVDESFTSLTAAAELDAAGRHARRRAPGDVDAAAAAAILRRFLETPNPSQISSKTG